MECKVKSLKSTRGSFLKTQNYLTPKTRSKVGVFKGKVAKKNSNVRFHTNSVFFKSIITLNHFTKIFPSATYIAVFVKKL